MFRYLALLFMASLPARAETPRIATDLPAVHSLIAQVAGEGAGIGFIMRPGASPHGYAMRPSEAQILQQADLVIWTGPEMSPGLERAIITLAPEARVLALLGAPGTLRLDRRERAVFGTDGHEDHAHGETHEADDHGHDHGDTDPHAWLDPANARAWLAAIADALAEADPENAAAYRANAARASAALDALEADIATRLAPVQGREFVVFHDAYQYFEARFGLTSAAAISPADASSPGPRRLSELRAALAGHDVLCAFSEPQFDPAMVATLLEGTDIRNAVLDPLGREIPPGPGLYAALLTGMADTIAACLSESG